MDNYLISEIQKNYNLDKFLLIPTKTGINNKTYIIKSNKEKFILKIYREKYLKKIMQEHKILDEIYKQTTPFKVPILKKNKDNKSLTLIESGEYLSLFHYIQGNTYNSIGQNNVQIIGEATGNLLEILKSTTVTPFTVPHHRLFERYSLIERNNIEYILKSKKLNLSKVILKYLLMDYEEVDKNLFKLNDFKKQIIHGDLTIYNFLFNERCDSVEGIIDFENFCYDNVCMEYITIITSLVDLKKPNDQLNILRIEKFTESLLPFKNTFNFSEFEISPFLLVLRNITMLNYFLNRFIIDETEENLKLVNSHIMRLVIWKKWLTKNSIIFPKLLSKLNI